MVMMVTSPTFFATLFAVKTAGGLCALALVNVGFVTACALSVPFAFKYSPGMREDFLNSLENVPRRFAELAVARAAAPFAARACGARLPPQRATAVRAEPRASIRPPRGSGRAKSERKKPGPGHVPRRRPRRRRKDGRAKSERKKRVLKTRARSVSKRRNFSAAPRRRRTPPRGKRSPPEPTGSRPNSARAPCVSAARHRSA